MVFSRFTKKVLLIKRIVVVTVAASPNSYQSSRQKYRRQAWQKKYMVPLLD